MNSGIDGVLESIEADEYEQASARDTGGGSRTAVEGIGDGELRALLDERQTTIKVIGCGGAGCNTVDRMRVEGMSGAELVALNTDAQHLSTVRADSKLLIGQNVTGGKGAGSVPQVGERAARENQRAIREAVAGADMVFITAGLGGGTGTGSAPVVTRAANEAGALSIAIVTQPFSAEGGLRQENAAAGLERLREEADTVIVIPNDRLLESVGNLPVQEAFKVADEVLRRGVTGVTELITESRLVNLDFADVQTVMTSGGVAMIGFGESDSQRKATDALRNATRSPLLDVEIESAEAALVNVTGGPEMTIEQAEGVIEHLYERIDPGARIIWGTGLDQSLEATVRVMLVVTGIDYQPASG